MQTLTQLSDHDLILGLYTPAHIWGRNEIPNPLSCLVK